MLNRCFDLHLMEFLSDTNYEKCKIDINAFFDKHGDNAEWYETTLEDGRTAYALYMGPDAMIRANSLAALHSQK